MQYTYENIELKKNFFDAFYPFYYYFMCMGFFYLHTCLCTRIPGAPRGQKKQLDSPVIRVTGCF